MRYNKNKYMKPLGKVKIKWSPEFAYAIGLIVTDGNLSPDKRHINFTTKDKELAELFRSCLRISNKVGRKSRGYEKEKKYYCVQLGDVMFYEFLESIGLMPRKSKIMSKIKIPREFMFDFLRGHLDGDGTFHSYWDPRWESSFMFYTIFTSASKDHIRWLRDEISRLLKIKGHITNGSKTRTFYQLKYAKRESLQLLAKIYYDKFVVCLSRKRRKIERALAVEDKQL